MTDGWLLNMTPAITVNDMLGGSVSSPNLFGYLPECQSNCAQEPYLKNGIRLDGSRGMRFAAKLAVFLGFVDHIVRLCSQLKMVRVDTSSIVARMTYSHILRYLSIVKERPSKAMGAKGASLMGNFTVPGRGNITRPFPALAKADRDESSEEQLLKRRPILIGVTATSVLRAALGNDMLRHVDTFLSRFGHAAGCFRTAAALLLDSSIIAQMVYKTKSVDTYTPLLQAAYERKRKGVK